MSINSLKVSHVILKTIIFSTMKMTTLLFDETAIKFL